jgi:hypothetical protein
MKYFQNQHNMPFSVLLYKIVFLVPLVYILIVISMVNDMDVKENENKVKDYVIVSEQGEEVNKRMESLDNFVPEEVEIIFVRRRSKLNERQRANYDD